METIIKLSKIEAVFWFGLEWAHQTDVELINPNTGRKLVFGKARVKGKNAKEYVKEQIDKLYDVTEFAKMNKRFSYNLLYFFCNGVLVFFYNSFIN